MLRWNPQTGQMEDDGSGPQGLDQAPAAAAPISVLPPQQPITVIPPGEELPPAPVVPTPGAAPPSPIAEPPAVKSESKTTTTREVPTKAEGGLNQKIAGEFTQQAGLTKQEGDINRREAETAATGAEEEAKVSGSKQGAFDKTIADQSALIKQAQDKVTADRSKYDAEVQRLGQLDIKGFYEGDEGRGRAIGNTIAVALGEIGRIFLKNRAGPNVALQAIHDQEDIYYRDQKARIDKQKDVISAARDRVSSSQGGLTDARQAKMDQLADLNLSFAARSQAIADKFKAEGARIGTEHALVTSQKMATAEEQRRDMFLEGYQQSIRQKVATESQTSSGPANDGTGGRAAGAQMQKATLAAQMKDDFAVVDSLPPLSEASKSKIQENATKIKLAEEASAHGGISGTMGVLAGRNVGLVPKSLYEGLPPDQARVANAMHLLAQKAAALISTSHSADEVAHSRSMFDPTAPDAAGTPQQQMDMMRKIMLENAALGGKYTGMAEAAGATTPHVPGGPAAGGGGAAPNDIDRQAVEWAQAHHQDPRAKQILQLHGM